MYRVLLVTELAVRARQRDLLEEATRQRCAPERKSSGQRSWRFWRMLTLHPQAA